MHVLRDRDIAEGLDGSGQIHWVTFHKDNGRVGRFQADFLCTENILREIRRDALDVSRDHPANPLLFGQSPTGGRT